MKRATYILFISGLLLSVFILGCSEHHTSAKDAGEFDVILFDAVHADAYMSEDDVVLENMSFTIQNNELFDLNCSVFLIIGNSSNSTIKQGVVGFLGSGEQKRVSLTFEMLSGSASLSVKPACSKP